MAECGRLLHRIQESGDNQLTCKMCAQILRKCLQRVLFPSNIKLFLSLLRPVPCVFEGQPVKNPEVAVWYPIHIHHSVLLPLSPGHSLTLLFQADTAELSAVTHVPHFPMLFSTFCRRQSCERLQSKCFVLNSWTLSLSLWVFLKPAEMNCLVPVLKAQT